MAGLTLRKYAEHINAIIFHKYNIVVQYFDMNFKYRNVSSPGNPKYRFEIFGIVDYLPNFRKEYLIYSEERTIDVAEWKVRIPEIDAELKPGQEENISQIYPLQSVYRGHDYNDPLYPSTGIAIGIYDSASIYSAQTYADGVYDNSIKLTGLRYIPVNTNDIMGSFISQSYYRFNDYPGINILSENTDENPTKMYYFIPWGVSGYKIVLSSTNGEKDTTFISGPLVQNNWQKATAPSFLPAIPLGNPSQSVHLAHIVPNGVNINPMNPLSPFEPISEPIPGSVPNIIGSNLFYDTAGNISIDLVKSIIDNGNGYIQGIQINYAYMKNSSPPYITSLGPGGKILSVNPEVGSILTSDPKIFVCLLPNQELPSDWVNAVISYGKASRIIQDFSIVTINSNSDRFFT